MQAIFGQNDSGHGFNLLKFLKAVNLYYLIMLVGIVLLSPHLFTFKGHLTGKLFLLGVMLMVGVFTLEVIFSHVLRCLKAKKWLALHLSFVGTTRTSKSIILTLLLAFFEELTYRLLWFAILLEGWNLPIGWVLLITSISYAWNHLLIGKHIFYAKLLTGLLYGCIYYVTANIWLVFIVHIGGNLLVESLSRIQTLKKKVA